ncbi:MAG: multiubiquitin domain-containing protein [Pseudomonadota bacterium]
MTDASKTNSTGNLDSTKPDADHQTGLQAKKEFNMGNKPANSEIIDIEQFLASAKPVPPGSKYQIRIDKDVKVVDVDHLTGRQLLALVGKTPEKFLLRQRINGSVLPVAADDVVSFLKPGLERFMTVPNEVTEGEGPQPRRQFTLLKADAEYLDGLGLCWEAVVEGGVQIVIIYSWPLPVGYNVSSADVHVRFSSGYPDTHLDMAYFAPALSRANGRTINAVSALTFDGRQWQQWSRHRTSNSAWRPGIDDLSTHMSLVEDWVAAELRK